MQPVRQCWEPTRKEISITRKKALHNLDYGENSWWRSFVHKVPWHLILKKTQTVPTYRAMTSFHNHFQWHCLVLSSKLFSYKSDRRPYRTFIKYSFKDMRKPLLLSIYCLDATMASLVQTHPGVELPCAYLLLPVGKTVVNAPLHHGRLNQYEVMVWLHAELLKSVRKYQGYFLFAMTQLIQFCLNAYRIETNEGSGKGELEPSDELLEDHYSQWTLLLYCVEPQRSMIVRKRPAYIGL